MGDSPWVAESWTRLSDEHTPWNEHSMGVKTLSIVVTTGPPDAGMPPDAKQTQRKCLCLE